MIMNLGLAEWSNWKQNTYLKSDCECRVKTRSGIKTRGHQMNKSRIVKGRDEDGKRGMQIA